MEGEGESGGWRSKGIVPWDTVQHEGQCMLAQPGTCCKELVSDAKGVDGTAFTRRKRRNDFFPVGRW